MSFSWSKLHWLSFTFNVKLSLLPWLKEFIDLPPAYFLWTFLLFLYSMCYNHVILLAIFLEYVTSTSSHLHLEVPISCSALLPYFHMVHKCVQILPPLWGILWPPYPKYSCLSILYSVSLRYLKIHSSSLSFIDCKFHEDRNFILFTAISLTLWTMSSIE